MTTIHLAIFGIGNVGSTLINQIQQQKRKIYKHQDLDIQIPVIANSALAFFANDTLGEWEVDFEKVSEPYNIKDIINHFKALGVEHAIAIDATASAGFVENYTSLIENGFHIIAANKIANTLDYNFYKDLRKVLNQNNKKFLYETNVCAGLPIVETVRNLHQSGEEIRKIKGVFSGSLSYIFNTFSQQTKPFHEVLDNAVKLGLTEPDPRDDLSGKDVARKLLILARELDLKVELSSISITSLVPKKLNGSTTLSEFKERAFELDDSIKTSTVKQNKDTVLRYIGELDVLKNTLEVKLVSVPKASTLGQLKGTDNLIEIYTESYNEQPLVIQGAGAGKAVTARGVLSDILKLCAHLQKVNVHSFN
ncbi:homoserine dehydrogenase family protein [Winogradskyella algicola]|uniref:aspartate kinase n=1 Tax=Winogradskyella algicola TaxID=2575815 RepID=UPI0011080A5A|nr:aspartate kinase [Winogradskyella algicola]